MTVESRVLGQLERVDRNGQQVIFEFGPSRLAVAILSDQLLRVRYAFDGQFKPRRSWAVTQDDSDYPAVHFEVVEDNPVFVEIRTARLKLRVRRDKGGLELLDAADDRLIMQDLPAYSPERRPDGSLQSLKVMPDDEFYYGFGERTSLLEKRGRRYTCWTTDPVDTDLDHGPGTDMMYQAIPFYMALRPRLGGYGLFFNNTYKTVFDVGYKQPGLLEMEAASGELDYYLIYGPDPAAIVRRYTALTGRTPLPPRWALGYHQSRWSYFPEGRIRELAESFRARRLPAEVIHLDIDYMQGYRVFTWDAERFPDPARLCADLAAQGFKVVTIIDPGVKYDPHNNYRVFDEGEKNDYFVRKADGELFHGYVWPDDSVFPDFVRSDVREWWGDLHRGLLEAGVRGIWNDMNEPAIASTPFGEWGLHIQIPDDAPQGDEAERATHAETHNLYGYLEDRATYEGLRRLQPDTRPFLLTRAGYAGIQRYSAVWTGDNSALWEHLEMAMPQLANLGLSGVSFAGTDIGGFWGAGGAELWARWIEFGAFSAFSRGHSALDTPPKEPWAWGETVERIARKYLELRYRFLPFLYTLFEENSRTGAPLLRPMLYQFWHDPATMLLHDQVMLGQALLLAPVYRPGAERRYVYLPQGAGGWYDFWSGEPIEETHLLAHAPFDHLPLYVRGGSILTLGPVMQYSDERPLDLLSLEIYLDERGQAEGELYEDDGTSQAYQRGESCRTTYTVTTEPDGMIRLTARRAGVFQPAPRGVEIRFHPPRPRSGPLLHRLEDDAGNWQITLDSATPL